MSLKYLFNPRSIAVIGASNNQLKIGRQILDNIIQGGYGGKVFPINLQDKKIAGLKAYSDLAAVPESRSAELLVVIAIPAQFVVVEVEKCAKLGIKNIIIISAGFKESGLVGERLEKEINILAIKYNLNILGPNCLGLINAKNKLNATFAATNLRPGKIALLSQSGAIGSIALDWLRLKDLGLAYFISLGNKTMLDENKLLAYLADDDQVEVIAVYLEEIKNGQKLMSLISRLIKNKPVLILKAGQSLAGGQLALSHTGSLAGSNAVIKAGLERAGGIWLENLSELFNFLILFNKKSSQVNINQSLSIITNAGGPAVLAVDELSRQKITFGGSFDLLGDAQAKDYEAELKKRLSDPKINNLLVILTPQTVTEPLQTARVIVKYAKKYPRKLIITSFVGGSSVIAARQLLETNNIASFSYPEEAIRSFKNFIIYKQNSQNIKPYKESGLKIKSVVNNTDYLQSLDLLRIYGFDLVKTFKYEKINVKNYSYPVVLKAVGPNFLHKSDQGAVVVNLKNQAELTRAALELQRKNKLVFNNSLNYLIVQPMANGFQEIIMGFKRDSSFGVMMMIGLGGIYAEVFKEIRLTTSDLGIAEALSLIKSLKIYPILNGARGQKKYDINTLAKYLVKLARLANEHPEIKELDINPLFVFNRGAKAADVRLIL